MTLFCKDCKHMVPPEKDSGLDPSVARCKKGNSAPSLVTGEEAPLDYCAVMRVHKCGPEGKLFEPVDYKPINLEQDDSTQAAAREYSDLLMCIAELHAALQGLVTYVMTLPAPQHGGMEDHALHVARRVLAKGKA